MHSRTSGPIATILMFIPLLAVPLLAVFGIPQFAPGVAVHESADEESPDELVIASSAAPQVPRAPAEDLFAPFETEDASSQGVRTGAGVDVANWEDPFQYSPRIISGQSGERAPIRPIAATLTRNWQSEPIRRPRSPFEPPGGAGSERVAEFVTLEQVPETERGAMRARAMPVVFEMGPAADGPGGRPFRAGPTAEMLTWQTAVRRLKELGIHDFQLEPGMAANQFQFRCSFTRPDNPRIIHQFQAEAAEPLLAVQDVLNQIDEWLGIR